MKNIVMLSLAIFLFNSCTIEDLDGKQDDNINLSTKYVEFTANTDSVIITTEGGWWWINGVFFEDSTYSYYGREDIDLESISYKITEVSFEIERRDKNTLYVKINENQTGIARTMRISLEAGDYFDGVTIVQAAN